MFACLLKPKFASKKMVSNIVFCCHKNGTMNRAWQAQMPNALSLVT
jgi:hypothetical protein